MPETEAETEEPPQKPPVISVGGLFDFEAPLSPSGITYVITITADGDLEEKSIQTITNQAICIVDSGLDFSFERDSKGDTGYLYLTVNWDKPGTYHITVGVDGKSYPATITVK